MNTSPVLFVPLILSKTDLGRLMVGILMLLGEAGSIDEVLVIEIPFPVVKLPPSGENTIMH